MDDNCCRRFFLNADAATYQRQYEALRAVFVDGLPQGDVAENYGYTHGSMRQLVYGFRTAMRAGSPPPFFKSPRSAGHRTTGRTTHSVQRHPLSPTSEHARSAR
jgi:hypothetical protein